MSTISNIKQRVKQVLRYIWQEQVRKHLLLRVLHNLQHEDIQGLQDLGAVGQFPGARVQQPQKELFDELSQGHQRDSHSQ